MNGNYIPSSETVPIVDYNVYRNDRNSNGGGVFILAQKSLTVEEQPQLVTECEINWIKLKLQNTKDLYFGAFYLPNRNEPDILELEKSLKKLTNDGTRDVHIILAGDLYSPDINWEHHTVDQGANDRALQQLLANIASSNSLTQVHFQPTRLSNILDLTFTTNPS